MTRPQTVLRSIKEAIKESGRLPDETSYATFELDNDGGQANIHPPVVEITNVDTIRSDPHNTNLVGHSTDNSGNQIGYIFRAHFTLNYQIDIWVQEGGGFDPDEMLHEARTALREYDNRELGNTLPDPDDTSNTLSEITHFYLGDQSPENDLTMTPALRRRRQLGEVWYYDEIDTAEEYGPADPITDVVVPEDGSFESGTSIEVIFDATPSTDSPADNF